MASLRAGNVYIIHTALVRRKPPQDKITICVCAGENLFVWFNSKSQRHGHGQLACKAQAHPALARDCFLDLSRVTTFRDSELAGARDRGPISDELRAEIVKLVRAGIKTLPPRHADLIVRNLA